eukprot:531681-Amphidinium_carterae.2
MLPALCYKQAALVPKETAHSCTRKRTVVPSEVSTRFAVKRSSLHGFLLSLSWQSRRFGHPHEVKYLRISDVLAVIVGMLRQSRTSDQIYFRFSLLATLSVDARAGINYHPTPNCYMYGTQALRS